MAMVDARYNSVVVDVGVYGKQSNGNVLANSTFGKKRLNMDSALPPQEPNKSEPLLPFVFVGDEAFPFSRTSSGHIQATTSLMKRGYTTTDCHEHAGCRKRI